MKATSLLSTLFITCLILVCIGSAALAEDGGYRRTVEAYDIPDVVLTNQNGEAVSFRDIVQSDKPVILNFIFSTCAAICPVLSASFVNLQQEIGTGYQDVRLVSISIDPENDTPKELSAFLKRYGAKPGWDFFTGPREAINTILLAFKAYTPNKMYLYPLTLIRSPEDGKWIRIFGIMNNSEFISECRKAGIK
jgi:protein SCO1